MVVVDDRMTGIHTLVSFPVSLWCVRVWLWTQTLVSSSQPSLTRLLEGGGMEQFYNIIIIYYNNARHQWEEPERVLDSMF